MSQDAVPIPQPRGLPIVGNALDFDAEYPLGTVMRLADQYGATLRLDLGVGRFPG
jgi:cytochrome P450/NADPH-cytochrome P450 reductase